ncbi:calmodulin-binding transcription activator 1 [Selaginella moellendorffii]|uniref:calmodulin-binding transcription activator 1 n=1 Tax=Selaginella moellendorffii TaxID=88036 RepID=UPI000D1CB985|nr:calmodulin-binding transcription activator 1 [Selaginella moellendorffii]|eukprot:XP_024537773.1 calmodulin-binding transcription activator 1 [Selaginella moellendorffii]
MATGGRVRGVPQQDLGIRQIISEACVRWLKPPEVCEILRHYQSYGFNLNPVPPNRPASGSLFLFDRKALRYFRKDGHNWRKKKDGKTVREAHERLKSGSIDVLHCYYAHGEEDPNFQRRSYWMLEGAYEHIVLVHYLQVHQGRASSYRPPEHPEAFSHAMSPSVSSEHDDVDSSDDVEQIDPPLPPPEVSKPQPSLFHQLSSKDWSVLLSETQQDPVYQQQQQQQQPQQQGGFFQSGQGGGVLGDDIDLNDLLDSPDKFLGQKGLTPAVSLDTSGWNEVLRSYRENPTNGPVKQEVQEVSWKETLEQCTTPATRDALLGQVSPMKFEDCMFKSSPRAGLSPKAIMDVLSPRGLGRQPQSLLEAQLRAATAENAMKTAQSISPTKQRWRESVPSPPPAQNVLVDMGRASQQTNAYQNTWQQQQQPQAHQPWQAQQYELDTGSAPVKNSKPVKQEESPADNLKKLDSFGRWVMQEMGDDSPGALLAPAPGDSGSLWIDDDNDREETSNLSTQMQLDMSVSIAQVQRFSITDFSPDWAPSNEETKVLVSGRFLPTVSKPLDVKWCCMFGDVEVPADLIDVGVLRCKVPPRGPGRRRIPFYITCSDRLACSEVREFEIRDVPEQQSGQLEREALLQLRFSKMLLSAHEGDDPKATVEWKQMEDAVRARSLSATSVKEMLLQAYFKLDLELWLGSKRSASVLDEHGQGLVHMASALGYDWALKPILDAGVVPNFRDVRGWTALHWAAAFGREETVVALIAAGTNPSLVTDPTSKHPNGQLPSDLASAAGHKGIAGFLAEKALTGHLSSLTIADTSLNEINSMSATLAGESAVQEMKRPVDEEHQSLLRSFSAVRNATKAAALIHSAYRLDSFRRRSGGDGGEENPDDLGMQPTELHAMAQTIRRAQGHRDHHGRMQSVAALQIQRKFRGWKGRKDFLALRRHVVRIQAHVRGHQVRKQLRKILRVVSVIEKAVLRWRRKRVGLRGFKPDNTNGVSSDDDDYLREGRKQKEIVLDKAVARVQSMARSEQGRDQYRRMLEGSQSQDQDTLEDQVMVTD